MTEARPVPHIYHEDEANMMARHRYDESGTRFSSSFKDY